MALTRMLIAALGGEGGGVITNWIVAAAEAENIPVQATSIPGVAQRTGATTYYLEFSKPSPGSTKKVPIFALMPVAGDVDILLATELLEAVRMAERGFVTPDRTFLLSSTHRILTTQEKLPRGDGRLDAAALMRTAEKASANRFLSDFQALAQTHGAPINAVLLGALAKLDLLPMPAKALRKAVETSGIAVAQNLKAFDAGFAAASDAAGSERDHSTAQTPVTETAVLAQEIAQIEEPAREICRLGAERLKNYQNPAYARQYLDRLKPFADNPKLMREVARHLAVRMSFEDIIRVAQLKIKASRFAHIRADIGAGEDDVIEIVDYFKPGIPELADILPPWLGRALLKWADKKTWRDKAYFGMKVRTTTISGFLRVWMLAKLKFWRRYSLRFTEEQKQIDQWLALVAKSRAISDDFALQTADMARLVKGYGETYQRGQGSYDRLVEELVMPALSGKKAVEEPTAQLKGAIAGILASS